MWLSIKKHNIDDYKNEEIICKFKSKYPNKYSDKGLCHSESIEIFNWVGDWDNAPGWYSGLEESSSLKSITEFHDSLTHFCIISNIPYEEKGE